METKPLCVYFGECGGCVIQHVPYQVQLQNKQKYVIDQCSKNNLVIPENIEVYSDEPYHYRSRMDFIFFNGGLGLRQKNHFNKIIPIKNCVISNQTIHVLLNEVWDWYLQHKNELDIFDFKKLTGTLKYLVIRAAKNTDSTTISLILSSDSKKISQHVGLIGDFASKTTAKNVVVGMVDAQHDLSTSAECFEVKGSLVMEEIIDGKKISYFSQSFFQNNTAMAGKMVHHLSSLLQKYNTSESLFVDLYGGSGLFGICLAHLFKKIKIIDNDVNTIECAKQNIANNNIDNSEVISGDASKISNIQAQNTFLLVDPPRTGLHKKVIDQILALKPSVIFYVSCNPEQMAKELRIFSKYYSINSLAVFDLFPQTNHIEAVAELTLQ